MLHDGAEEIEKLRAEREVLAFAVERLWERYGGQAQLGNQWWWSNTINLARTILQESHEND